MTIVSVYAVFANQAEAESIGRIVVEERLAACINVLGQCRSIYRWQGTIEQTDEVPAILKTDAAHIDALIARIAELHCYAVPAIVAWPVHTALAAYADWVDASVFS